MRVLLLLFLVPIAALADPLDCGNAGVEPGVLTSQQWDALGTSSPSSDPILLESRFLFSKESRPISAKEMRNATPIPWETGQKANSSRLGKSNFQSLPRKIDLPRHEERTSLRFKNSWGGRRDFHGRPH